MITHKLQFLPENIVYKLYQAVITEDETGTEFRKLVSRRWGYHKGPQAPPYALPDGETDFNSWFEDDNNDIYLFNLLLWWSSIFPMEKATRHYTIVDCTLERLSDFVEEYIPDLPVKINGQEPRWLQQVLRGQRNEDDPDASYPWLKRWNSDHGMRVVEVTEAAAADKSTKKSAEEQRRNEEHLRAREVQEAVLAQQEQEAMDENLDIIEALRYYLSKTLDEKKALEDEKAWRRDEMETATAATDTSIIDTDVEFNREMLYNREEDITNKINNLDKDIDRLNKMIRQWKKEGEDLHKVLDAKRMREAGGAEGTGGS